MNSDDTYRTATELYPSLPRQVHTITDRFSMANTYLIEDNDHVIVVDPGTALNVHQLERYIPRILKRPVEQIDLIVLTHLHTDHTAGIAALRRITQAPVAAAEIIQRLAQAQLATGEHTLSPFLSQFTEHLLPYALQHFDIFPPAYAQHLHEVSIWLHDTQGLPGHPNWRVIASPGHTPESLSLYNPFSWELLCGDTAITIQGGAPLVHGTTNHPLLEQTLHVLRSLHVHYLYPGHGRPILGEHPLANSNVTW